MRWWYEWRYHRNQRKAVNLMRDGSWHTKYPNLYEFHIEKMRYYASKLGDM